MLDILKHDDWGSREPLILASKRGPLSLQERGDKSHWAKSPGGMVQVVGSALEPGDRWVSMLTNGHQPPTATDAVARGLQLRYVDTDARTCKLFEIACNRVLWFALHGLPIPDVGTDTLITSWEEGYVRANSRLAEVIAEEWERDPAVISIHDYQFFLAAAQIRELVPDAQIMFFCHTPFPDAEQIRSLSLISALDILRGMLACDLVGFQSYRDVAAFRSVCSSHLGLTVRRDRVEWKGRTTEVGVFPVTVGRDLGSDEVSSDPPQVSDDLKVITWMGRSDPAKNPVGAIDSFRQLLSEEPRFVGRVSLLLKMYPSRQEFPEYRQCLLQAQEAAIRMNAEMATDSWVPVLVDLSKERSRAEGALRRADVLLVNSFADGMNLVVQEGLLLSERSPVLVLSKETGAWERLPEGAISIDPWDQEDVLAGLKKALDLSTEEREARHATLLSQLDSLPPPQGWLQAQLSQMVERRPDREKVKLS